MRGEGILSEYHDERGRSFAPGRGTGRDAGPRCAAAECARYAHRAIRRHVRSAPCGAPRRLPAGAAPALAHHPRIDVTDLEAELGTAYTYETVSYLRRRCPGVHFVWIMGADNLRSFHRWQRWRGIAQLVPIAIVDRLGPSLYATGSAAAQALARYRLPEAAATKLADHKPPAWIYLHGLKSPLSSTALRAARALKRR